VRAFEQERDRWYLWLPVLYAIGIALYMALPVEPPIAATLTPALAAIALRVAWQRGAAAIPVTACLLAVTLGVAGAKLRTMWIAAPKLEKELRRAEVAGYADVERAGSWQQLKEQGLLRSEGKDYVVQDGDVIHFRFNV